MASYYDTYDYPAYWEDRVYEHESEVHTLRAFLSRIPKIQDVIDLGGGFGRLTPHYAYRANSVTILDPSKKLLKTAMKNYERLITRKKLSAKLATIPSRIEYASKRVGKKRYDLAIMVRVMHHLENPEKAIMEVSKILEPKGYFVLEFANKLHAKSLFQNFCRGNFTYLLDITPEDKRSRKNRNNHTIGFYNYHPDVIQDLLKKHKFTIIESRSVSNIRSGFLKKHVPVSILVEFEKLLQKPFAKMNFGPSIFILAQKKG